MEKFKKQAGVTMIALVVTITILGILAGISINMIVGDNGIINQAHNAENAMNESQGNEQALTNEFLAELEKENVTDAELSIGVVEKTSNTIMATAAILNGDEKFSVNVLYNFYIKKASEADSSYTLINSSQSAVCTFTGLNSNTAYKIKVTVTEINGTLHTAEKIAATLYPGSV